MSLNQSESTSVFRLCLNTDLTRLSRFPRDTVANQNTEKSTPRIPWLRLEKSSGKNPQKIHMSSSSLGLIFCKQKFSPPYFQNNLEINFSIIYTRREDPGNPHVFFDITIDGQAIGRIEFKLYAKDAPNAAENFRALSTGEKGTVPRGHEGAGKQYSFKGQRFYRIIDRFINQAGAGTDSVFGGSFKDDPGGLALKHDRAGLLSMANGGPDTNTSHFSIVVAAAPHLNGKYTVFGEVVAGMDVVTKINQLANKGSDRSPRGVAVIADCGQLN
ncbi:hypothetical protein CYMTET_20283 [Cymbomonas tetramitiformis]|uniref:Peptidyl-prolyl cis-trans isomerase n=1 Tax=Cymbomonas tetramitiformis TaxID=36881 RepID=A0AAE0G4U4_9CHLO|nr:hypothetical protein CYMTET_20283 [Cymbomonas tetramitiformis]